MQIPACLSDSLPLKPRAMAGQRFTGPLGSCLASIASFRPRSSCCLTPGESREVPGPGRQARNCLGHDSGFDFLEKQGFLKDVSPKRKDKYGSQVSADLETL